MNDDSCSRAEPLLAIIDLLYQASNPNDMAHEFFSRLSKIIPFDAAIFNPINWNTLEINEVICFGNITLNDLKTESKGITSYERSHFDLLCLTQLNTSVRLVDASSNRIFSTLQSNSYSHILGVIAGWCHYPVAFIKLFRPGSAPDFSDHESKVLDRLAIHAANALFLESTKSALEPIIETGLIVFDPEGNVLYRNDFVSKILGKIPLDSVLKIARNGDIWLNNGMELYRIEKVPLTPNNLLALYAKNVSPEAFSMSIDSAGVNSSTNHDISIISLKPFQKRSAIENRLKRNGLSPREIDVALKLMRGMSNSNIAKQMFIDETTVKDHLHRIYAKINIKTRTELISKLLGLDIELANHEIPIAHRINGGP